jgi:hypothetical protein
MQTGLGGSGIIHTGFYYVIIVKEVKMNKELKLCPFCACGHQVDIDDEFGGVAFLHQNYNWSNPSLDCILSIQEIDDTTKIEDFIKRWQSRPIEDALTATIAQRDAEVERLKAAAQKIVDVNKLLDDSHYTEEEKLYFCIRIAKQALKEVNDEV